MCLGSPSGDQAGRPWQSLYFLPEPQGQGALRETFVLAVACLVPDLVASPLSSGAE